MSKEEAKYILNFLEYINDSMSVPTVNKDSFDELMKNSINILIKYSNKSEND